MARRVFFSFHFQRDSHRVSQIRNSWTVRADHEAQPFLEWADWEKIERQGDDAVKRWIDTQLNGTSVTVVLIGAETAARRWVQYEIEKSFNDGKGLFGIRIHNMMNLRRETDFPGNNPFSNFTLRPSGKSMAEVIPVYDWVNDNGRQNISTWIETAAKAAGR